MTATLNPMCINCAKLNKSCNGTTNQVWTGCIYKEVKLNDEFRTDPH